MPRPPALRPDDNIGIIAPGSAPENDEAFAAGCRRLEARGYHLVRGRSRYEPHGYLSGSDRDRVEELHRMFGRNDLSTLFCVRGGFGTLRLLPEIDYELARRSPKLVVGYSDITALQLALLAKAGLPGISGPMLAVDWGSLDDRSEELFWALISGTAPLTVAPTDGRAPEVQRRGTAEGPLIGGNLSVLTRLLGTDYLPSLEGAILFLEDVDEPPYRIDGMLAQLRLAGVLEAINGMIFGQFTDSKPAPDKPSLTLDEVLDDYRGRISGPVISNFAYGHSMPFTSLPVGVRARLRAGPGGTDLTILEPAVATDER